MEPQVSVPGIWDILRWHRALMIFAHTLLGQYVRMHEPSTILSSLDKCHCTVAGLAQYASIQQGRSIEV